jgi:SAM-dependent methyltransferase
VSKKKEWFATWFDSPYYHLLYKSHDEKEAQIAIDKLLEAIDLRPKSRILDLACGKGRHARYLAQKGFAVTGLDISFGSILYAKQFEEGALEFYQHDMRVPFRVNYYDAVVNFFTSFGYFENDREHLLALKNMCKNLKPQGLLVLDFFNENWVRQNIIKSQSKTVDNIEFRISKSVKQGYVFKTVEFDTGGKTFYFREKVRLFNEADFRTLFEKAGLIVKKTYGGHDLAAFDPKTSKRLILIAQKN